ncbi:MAG: transposase [Acidobacteriota bacterium]
MHHVVAVAPWNDQLLLQAVRQYVLPQVTGRHPLPPGSSTIPAFPRKKGKHSVGVARQYCGQIGKQDNCQVAVSLSDSSDASSLPIAYELYLPETWSADPERRPKAGVPDEVVFRIKPLIAVEQIQRAVADGVPRAPVLADAAYGTPIHCASTTVSPARPTLFPGGIMPPPATSTQSPPNPPGALDLPPQRRPGASSPGPPPYPPSAHPPMRAPRVK